LPAAAQTAPAAPAGPRHDPALMQQRRAEMQQHFAQMRQRRADDLALLLDLKPGQRAALDAFLKASHPGMGKGRMGRPPEGAAPGATPPSFTDRLDRMEAATTRHADSARERIGAIKAFYTSLDPHQQQLFDALRRMRHGGMGRGGGMGHGGGIGGHMRGGHPGGHAPMGGPEAPQG
ncbi:MAG TPA: Spy/CpxP family protein refolding chaperone, partial [Sphingomonas sp.]|nr:Spy/CpxP family protein refolding chaperone [Sphingomonas sp.]